MLNLGNGFGRKDAGGLVNEKAGVQATGKIFLETRAKADRLGVRGLVKLRHMDSSERGPKPRFFALGDARVRRQGRCVLGMTRVRRGGDIATEPNQF